MIIPITLPIPHNNVALPAPRHLNPTQIKNLLKLSLSDI